MKKLKIDNKLLVEAQNLEAVIQSAQTRLSDIKGALKAKGSFTTKDFVVAVLDQHRTSLAGVEAFKDKGYDLQELKKEGLVNEISFKVVKIARRIA